MMTRGVTVLVAALTAVSSHGIQARGISDRPATTDTRAGVIAPAKHDDSRHGITIRHIRLEPAPPMGDSPTVILKFDLRNDTDASMTDIVVSVSIRGPAVGALEPRPALMPRFRIRIKRPLPARYSLDYQIRLRPLSLDADCLAEVEIVGARSFSSISGAGTGALEQTMEDVPATHPPHTR